MVLILLLGAAGNKLAESPSDPNAEPLLPILERRRTAGGSFQTTAVR